MRAILLYSFFFGLAFSANSQQRGLLEPDKQPYTQVDTFDVDLKFLVLSPDKVESVNVLKDSNAVAAYGEKAKYGAIIIKTKPNTKLLRVGDILEKHIVSPADQKLRVCINNTVISSPELFLIDASEILGVEITTDSYWINPEDANSKEKFINIKTTSREKNSL
jgi:TonB-dependent SusC/RagA subfamily outer membrane receptor